MIGRLNHVALVVPKLEEAAQAYRSKLGAIVSAAQSLPEQGVRLVFVEVANTKIELLEPLGEDSTLLSFLKKNPARQLQDQLRSKASVNYF